MNPDKDYYAILGVLPTAAPEVIKAVYHALAKKHHPDRSGDPRSEEYFKEIAEAYEILSDHISRAQYDEALRQRNADMGDYNRRAEEQPDVRFDDYHEEWEFAVEYYPEIVNLKSEIAKLSPTLAVAFQATIIIQRSFEQAATVKDRLERGFLDRFFGRNHEIQAFAKNLLLNGNLKAARELNRAIKILGVDANPEIIIKRIWDKFGDDIRAHPLGKLYRGHLICETINGEYEIKNSSGNIVAGTIHYKDTSTARSAIDYIVDNLRR